MAGEVATIDAARALRLNTAALVIVNLVDPLDAVAPRTFRIIQIAVPLLFVPLLDLPHATADHLAVLLAHVRPPDLLLDSVAVLPLLAVTVAALTADLPLPMVLINSVRGAALAAHPQTVRSAPAWTL